MKTFMTLILLAFSSDVFADDCAAGTFIVYSASCSDETAKVYVRGERSAKTLKRTWLGEEDDNTAECGFNNGVYYLNVTEYGSKKTEYELSGCK